MKDILEELTRHRMTYRIGLRLTEAERAQVEAVAQEYGVTITAAARALLRIGLEVEREAKEKPPPPA